MSARELILARARAALGDTAVVPEIPRGYRVAGTDERTPRALAELLAERARDYRAVVTETTASALGPAVLEIAERHGARRLGAAPEIAAALGRAALGGAVVGGAALGAVELVGDVQLSVAQLDALDGVVTGCAVAIAETGTLILDGGARSGRRALTLVPDLHICIVEVERIVATVPDGVAWIVDAGLSTRPLTLVSGPSATSDIGFERVEGVHGPRRLEIVVVG